MLLQTWDEAVEQVFEGVHFKMYEIRTYVFTQNLHKVIQSICQST